MRDMEQSKKFDFLTCMWAPSFTHSIALQKGYVQTQKIFQALHGNGSCTHSNDFGVIQT